MPPEIPAEGVAKVSLDDMLNQDADKFLVLPLPMVAEFVGRVDQLADSQEAVKSLLNGLLKVFNKELQGINTSLHQLNGRVDDIGECLIREKGK